jgi:hypothetical protein
MTTRNDDIKQVHRSPVMAGPRNTTAFLVEFTDGVCVPVHMSATALAYLAPVPKKPDPLAVAMVAVAHGATYGDALANMTPARDFSLAEELAIEHARKQRVPR